MTTLKLIFIPGILILRPIYLAACVTQAILNLIFIFTWLSHGISNFTAVMLDCSFRTYCYSSDHSSANDPTIYPVSCARCDHHPFSFSLFEVLRILSPVMYLESLSSSLPSRSLSPIYWETLSLIIQWKVDFPCIFPNRNLIFSL